MHQVRATGTGEEDSPQEHRFEDSGFRFLAAAYERYNVTSRMILTV
jgi:hypothetical protein